MRGADRDRGSATVLMLAVIAVALMLALGVVGLARASAARGLAQGAADLAALAAARAAVDPAVVEDPCGLAAQVVARHGARLVGCEVVAGAMVQVRVAVDVTIVPGWSDVASAEALAGPVDARGPSATRGVSIEGRRSGVGGG